MVRKGFSFIFVVIFLMPLIGLAQNETTIEYYDSEWNQINSKEDASFYREIRYDSLGNPVGITKDYYISGELQWKGRLVKGENDSLVADGLVTYYYKNGNKEMEVPNDSGSVNGVVSIYRESGELKEKRVVEDDQLLFLTTYYKSGNMEIIANFNEKGELKDNTYIECDELGVCEEILSEDFKNSNVDWPLYDNENITSEIKNGIYTINLNTRAGLFLTTYKDIDQSRDFSVRISGKFHRTNDKAILGIGFGFKDYDSNYSFMVRRDGYYSVKASINGSNLNIIDWKSTNKIRGNSYNELKVQTAGDQIGYYINGNLVDVSDKFGLKSYGFGPLVAIDEGSATFLINEFELRNEVNINPPNLKEISKEEVDKNTERWTGSGSGILISGEGHVLTNEHVIEGASEIQLTFNAGGRLFKTSGEVVTRDSKNDIAVIKIDPDKLPFVSKVPFSISLEELKVGAEVYTLGYPLSLSGLGQEVKFTDGNISSRSGFKDDITLYQISVPIQPGNSGGPLFNSEGNLVGITNAKITDADNVSYAIKSAYLRGILDYLDISSTERNSLSEKSITEQVEQLSKYVPLIKIRN